MTAVVYAGGDPNDGHVSRSTHVFVRSALAGVWLGLERSRIDEEGCGATIAVLTGSAA